MNSQISEHQIETILLDGFMGAPWRLSGMCRYLRKRGLDPVRIFSYDSTGRQAIEELAEQLREFCGEQPVRVAAHSMGGLIVRVAKARFPDWDLRRVAFLCVPHTGSVLANFIPLRGIRQLRPGSDLLKKLALEKWEVPTLSVWCPGDLIVVPGSSAKWPGAEREVCCAFPLHNWPVISPHYHELVADFFLES